MREGIDVAAYQHPNGADIDYKAVRDSGIDWVAIKADEGTTYQNPFRAQDANGFFNVGCEVVFYHFGDPNTNVTSAAQHFLNSIPAPYTTSRRCLDFEQTRNLSWEACANWIDEFITSASVTLLYLNQSYYSSLRSYLKYTGDIWIAAPSLSTFPDYATVWQYTTNDVPGIQAPTDRNQVKDDNVPLTPDEIEAIAKRTTEWLADPAYNTSGTVIQTNLSAAIAQMATELWQLTNNPPPQTPIDVDALAARLSTTLGADVAKALGQKLIA